jgi:hypothetical protein
MAAEQEKDKKDKREELKAEADAQKAQIQEQQALKFRESAAARQSQARDQAQAQPAPAPSQQQVQVFAKAPPQTAQQGEPAKGAVVGGVAGGAGQARLAGGMLRTSPSTAKAAAESVVVEQTATNVLADNRLDKVGRSKKLGLLLPSDAKIAQTVRVKNSTRVWILLADGRLLLSLDGSTWEEVAVPERPKKLTVRDVDHVEFTAISGRVYRSIDGGASWVLVPPR